MLLSPKFKRNFRRVLPVALIWLIFGAVFVLIEKGLLADSTEYPATGTTYDFWASFPRVVIGSFIGGLLIGSIEVFFLNRLFRRQRFGVKLIFKTFIYVILICTFLIFLGLAINSAILGLPMNDPSVKKNVAYFVIDFAFWSTAIYIGIIVLVSLFVLEMGDNLGQGVLKNFITGKYHNPIEETRIFMFLDMKSSTTIAEHLGHVKYFKLLRAYYATMTNAVVRSSGEVYQYVGDEIVLSWTLRNGLRNQNCIRCFFNIKKQFRKRAAWFEKNFGVVPDFKAGYHFGDVTTGEIGEVKKEILFTGDVLNTTARIQSLCNTYNADLLISEKLLSPLKLPENRYTVTNMGEQELRGKDLKVRLFSIEEKRS
ncbi:adenylate/guanylate cyclase domain-containing protein [Leptobacterium flavescens]|uniref:Adenylate/guanylate cyclase domain-containing protein n=1 Tax=Leptobacterium flavescens TaxID=472055 RepID=A0A6P0USN8_9FLAO|nr:adenylate/guanylate cyclase domain-containing protein [Leptobacterium flavescens]NER13376.1 adenylate/guanylate cyclase domain-containing protein [Leptobacterium flavescens]